MKQKNRLMNWLVACGLALVMVASASAATERTGKVTRIKGAARYSTDGTTWKQLKVGDVLKAGTMVQTAADSFADVSIGVVNLSPVRASSAPPSSSYQPKVEQDVVRVQGDSVLSFDKLGLIDTGADQVTDTQLDLRSGKVFGTVKKLNASSRYEIKLPNGVAGVRGTIYQVSADGVVQVLTGSVVISWTSADGTVMTQTVNGGNQFDARTGLVTPLSESVRAELERISKGLELGRPAATTFIKDNTIYFVSPTTADNAPPEVINTGSTGNQD